MVKLHTSDRLCSVANTFTSGSSLWKTTTTLHFISLIGLLSFLPLVFVAGFVPPANTNLGGVPTATANNNRFDLCSSSGGMRFVRLGCLAKTTKEWCRYGTPNPADVVSRISSGSRRHKHFTATHAGRRIFTTTACTTTSTGISDCLFRSSFSPYPPKEETPRIVGISRRPSSSLFHSSSSMAEAMSTGEDVATHSPYEECVRRLYMTNLFNPVKMGLDNSQAIYELIGKPLDKENVAVVHIAGSNGKGSVALKTAQTIQRSDPSLKVGLFCSPHVSSFRERMQINSELITEEEVVEYLPEIYDHCEKNKIPATFFEITTALAFLFFARRNADVVVLETGLGGRLDATNIIANPALSIITSIGLEHTRILGDTIEKIATEKAGIIKPNCPVLVGPNCPHDVIRQCAKEKSSGQYYTVDDVFKDITDVPKTAILPSDEANDFVDYDIENNRITTAGLMLLQRSHPKIIPKLSVQIIEEGTSIRPPCRFECVQKQLGANTTPATFILDVAHNPPAMKYLVEKLKRTYPEHYNSNKIRVLLGMSSDKDFKLTMDYIFDLVKGDTSFIHLVEGFHPRAYKLEDMLKVMNERNDSDNHKFYYDLQDRSVNKQIQTAIELVQKANNDEIIVICGSVFLMPDAREELGFNEPKDSDYISQMAGANFKTTGHTLNENFGNSNSNKNSTTS